MVSQELKFTSVWQILTYLTYLAQQSVESPDWIKWIQIDRQSHVEVCMDPLCMHECLPWTALFNNCTRCRYTLPCMIVAK